MLNDFDYRFWVAVCGATLFKLLTSPWRSPIAAVVTVLAAIFSAWVFTDPVIHFMGWDPDAYREPVAALLALMGEGAMRWAMKATPERIIELWKAMRS